MKSDEGAARIATLLEPAIPRIWDGRDAIIQMRDGGSSHWRQMEWIGFYFEYVCENALGGHVSMPGPRYGNTGFDALLGIPWDLKAHVTVNRNGVLQPKLIVNDTEAVEAALREYGEVGVVLLQGSATYDDATGSFKTWHDRIKGGVSAYERDRVGRGAPSRRRKVQFRPTSLDFLRITQPDLSRLGTFQKGMRNSNGVARRSKVEVDLRSIGGMLVLSVPIK